MIVIDSLAIVEGGERWSWGNNSCGQLGDGSTTRSYSPVKVKLQGKKVIAIAAGGCHSLAITEQGECWSWGNNECGQLGDASTTDRSSPVNVQLQGKQVIAIAAWRATC